MTVKKLLVGMLVMVMVLGLMGGLVMAEDDYPAAPDVAGQILGEFDVDFRYVSGTVDHPRHGEREVYSNYIAQVAQTMTNGAEFPVYKCDGIWDEETYVEKCELDDYYWAVYNYLRSLGADLECPFCGVLDPDESGAEFLANDCGTGTLTVTLVDLCGNPILPEDFPIVPPTSTHDNLERLWTTYFRANSDSKDNPYFYFIGGRHFNADYPGLSSTSASHLELGVYKIILESVFDYDQSWEIGIGPWLLEEDVYVIEEVEITIETGRSSDGLALWLEASAYDAEEGEWTDWSGEGNHAKQDDEDKRPIYIPEVEDLKDQPVVSFDGQDDYLDVPTSLGIFRKATGGTIIVVAAPTKSSNVETLIGWSIHNDIYRYRYTLGKTGNDEWRTGGRRLDGDSFQIIVGGTIETGTFNLVSSVVSWENAVLRLFEDGIEVASSDSFQTSGGTSDTDSLGMAIGARPDGNDNNWKGDIAEILIYDRALNDPEREMVEAYLSAKYGI